MKISKLVEELNEVLIEYGDKNVVVVQYGNELGGDYEYGHFHTEEDNLVANYMDLSDEIEIYTKTE
jgi:hypothetical protein